MEQSELKRLYEEAGAVVLDFEYKDILVNDTEIRIGGFYGYGYPAGHEVERKTESRFLKQFENTERYKILLAHMPLGWYHGGSLDYWDVDLVLSGHTHGGQVRLPFLGGLFAPDRGWFPGRECGLYYSEDHNSVMLLSRGLGSTEVVPRFNNFPEIVVTDIVSKW